MKSVIYEINDLIEEARKINKLIAQGKLSQHAIDIADKYDPKRLVKLEKTKKYAQDFNDVKKIVTTNNRYEGKPRPTDKEIHKRIERDYPKTPRSHGDAKNVARVHREGFLSSKVAVVKQNGRAGGAADDFKDEIRDKILLQRDARLKNTSADHKERVNREAERKAIDDRIAADRVKANTRNPEHDEIKFHVQNYGMEFARKKHGDAKVDEAYGKTKPKEEAPQEVGRSTTIMGRSTPTVEKSKPIKARAYPVKKKEAPKPEPEVKLLPKLEPVARKSKPTPEPKPTIHLPDESPKPAPKPERKVNPVDTSSSRPIETPKPAETPKPVETPKEISKPTTPSSEPEKKSKRLRNIGYALGGSTLLYGANKLLSDKDK